MNANDEAVYALLVERADPDGCVRGVTRAYLVAALGVADGTAGLALRRLEAAGRLRREPSPGRAPSLYCLTVQPGDQPGDNPASEPGDNPASEPGDLAAPIAPARSPETTSSSNPSSGSGTSRAPAAQQPGEPGEPGDPASQPGDVVEIGQAVVAWAIDEQRRLGKPPLDGGLLKKLGSMAKRMDADGVGPTDLKRAAEYLVAHDMTALDAAHRKALAATAVPVEGERAELARLAAESRGARDPRSMEPHLESEMIELWSLIALTWRASKPIVAAERELWHAKLARFPMDCLLWAVSEVAKRGDPWPPTWGQVYELAAPSLREERERLRRWLDRKAPEGE